MTKLEMIQTLQPLGCGCISPYPGLLHQETKRENSDGTNVHTTKSAKSSNWK